MRQNKKQKRPYRAITRTSVITCTILTLLTPLSLWLIHYAKGHPAWVEEKYSLGWYRGAATALTALTGRAAFSFMEIVLLLAGVGILLYLCFWVAEQIRHPADWWRILLCRTWVAIAACSTVFFCFVLTGDLNYYRQPVGVSLGLTTEESDAATLKKLCLLLAQQANWLRAGAEEETSGAFTSAVEYKSLAEDASAYVAALDDEYGVELFSLAGRALPKAMRFSTVMSNIQLTGVIFPYLSEANINVDQPAFGIPSTMCHELSHICGYMREDEANFISYLACRGSGDRNFDYSGTMMALIHATNGLYATDRTAYKEVMAGLSPGVQRDLDANRTYWAQYNTPTGDVATKVNDAYLKANDQTDGVQSYGRMVDLLIAFYRSRGAL